MILIDEHVDIANCNNIPKVYEQKVKEIKWVLVTCPNEKCNSVGNFKVHGYYSKQVKLANYVIVEIVVKRMKCKSCKTTHAIFLSFMTPCQPDCQERCVKFANAHIVKKSSLYELATEFAIDIATVKAKVKTLKSEIEKVERLVDSFSFKEIFDRPSFSINFIKNYKQGFMQKRKDRTITLIIFRSD